MKKLLFILFLTISIAYSPAQSYKQILPVGADTALNHYLVGIMKQQYAERKRRLENALQTTEKLQAYQIEAKNQYKRLFTNFPSNYDQAMPEVESLGNIARDNYTIEKLILSKRITCNLYKPNTTGKKPGILFFCGHEMTSKATESYQKTAILLAKNGFVVLVVDPSGQGERVQLLDENGKSLTRGSTTEHTLLSMGAGLIGWSEVNEMLLDNIICMNYLCSLSEVDTEKIGCIGNSGGGAQTSYFSAMDSRVKAAACCSWFTKRERMFTLYGPDDGCQYLWNEGRTQLEIADYYIMQAPRPTLVLAGTKDFIDYQGAKEAYTELKQVYKKLGKESNAEYFEYADGHGISQAKREVAVRFFKKYFMNDSSTVAEGNLQTLPDSLLRCTKSGQLLSEYSNEDALQIRNQQMVQFYERYRRSFDQHNLDTCRSMLRNILNLYPNPNKLKANKQGMSIAHSSYEEELFILSRKGEPDMPMRILTPYNFYRREAKVYILLNDSGMLGMLNSNLTDSLIKAGHCLVLADPRGLGETKDRADKNNKKYYSSDYRNASLSLFIGKSLLSQRIADIITLTDYIKDNKSLRNCDLEIISNGNIGIAAQHAYFIDTRIKHSTQTNCIHSWREIIEQPTAKNRMSLLVPNALRFYDLDNLKY